MNSQHFEELAQTILSLARTISPHLPQQASSELDRWCITTLINFSNVHTEDNRRKLMAVDDVSLFYTQLIDPSLPRPYNLTGVDPTLTDITLDRKLTRYNQDVNDFLNLYFDQGNEPLIGHAYFFDLQREIKDAMDDYLVKHGNDIIVYKSFSPSGVGYTAHLRKIETGRPYEIGRYSLVIIHRSPWFIHPVVHYEYTTIDLANVASGIRSFIIEQLGIELPHLTYDVSLSDDIRYNGMPLLDGIKVGDLNHVYWENNTPSIHTRHSYGGTITQRDIHPMLYPELNYIPFMKNNPSF